MSIYESDRHDSIVPMTTTPSTEDTIVETVVDGRPSAILPIPSHARQRSPRQQRMHIALLVVWFLAYVTVFSFAAGFTSMLSSTTNAFGSYGNWNAPTSLSASVTLIVP